MWYNPEIGGQRRFALGVKKGFNDIQSYSDVHLFSVTAFTQKWFLKWDLWFQKPLLSYFLDDSNIGKYFWKAFDILLWMTCKKKLLLSTLKHNDPQKIISFSPSTTRLLALMKKKKWIATELACFVSEPYVHRKWMCPEVNFYYIPFESFRLKLISLGVAAEKIIYVGLSGITRHEKLPTDKPMHIGVICEKYMFKEIRQLVERVRDLGRPAEFFFFRPSEKVYLYLQNGHLNVWDEKKSEDDFFKEMDLCIASPQREDRFASLYHHVPLIVWGMMHRHQKRSWIDLMDLGLIWHARDLDILMLELKNIWDLPGEWKELQEKVDDLASVLL
jgi:hypothetical protein